MLTKNEQRVVILVILAVLAAAFVRYWQVVNTSPKPNEQSGISATAAPFPSPDEESATDQD